MTVAIIGAGPAGLSMARSLMRNNIPFTIYEKHSQPGGIWDINNPGTSMYEAAHFISSKTLSGFPEFPMPDHYPDYPGRKQILDYILSYVAAFNITPHIKFNTEVSSIQKNESGWVLTDSSGNNYNHEAVICANGPQWFPNQHNYPGNFSGNIYHSVQFKDSYTLKGKKVLVIGGGNSAADIACEAASFADKAFISMRRGYWVIPKHIFGIPSDVFAHQGPKLPTKLNQWVLKVLLKLVMGDQTKFGLPKPDHQLLESHPLLSSQLLHHTSHGNLKVKPDVDKWSGNKVFFKDGSEEEIDEIILAIGYKHHIPYANNFFKKINNRLDLYLNLFNRDHDNLFAIGFMETNSAAYEMYAEMAQLISNYLLNKNQNHSSAETFKKMIQERPDLSGDLQFVKSDRHSGYVDSDTYRDYIKKLQNKLGWKPYLLPDKKK